MCGIAGAIGLSYNSQTLEAMQKTMLRRGPDDKGAYRFTEGILLHTRLTIIDPEGGKQPMQLCQGEETYTITYNGEI